VSGRAPVSNHLASVEDGVLRRRQGHVLRKRARLELSDKLRGVLRGAEARDAPGQRRRRACTRARARAGRGTIILRGRGQRRHWARGEWAAARAARRSADSSAHLGAEERAARRACGRAALLLDCGLHGEAARSSGLPRVGPDSLRGWDLTTLGLSRLWRDVSASKPQMLCCEIDLSA
jgi:hypothetical protein